MRVSELVKSFEDQIALSPKSLSPRSKASAGSHQRSDHEPRREYHECRDEAEALFEAHSGDLSPVVASDDKAKVAAQSEADDHITEEEEVEEEQKELTSVHHSEHGYPEPIHLILPSHSLELTDEAGVKVRTSEERQSTAAWHAESPRELLSEPRYSQSSSENEIESVCSELTDEREAPDTHYMGNDTYLSKTKQHAVETHQSATDVGTQTSVDYDQTSNSSKLSDEFPKHGMNDSSDAKIDTVEDVEREILSGRDMQQEVSAESQLDALESQNEPLLDHRSLGNLSLTIDCEYPCAETSREASPEAGNEPQHVHDDNIAPPHSSDYQITNMDDADVHKLLYDMEQSMDARFRRLEESCQQIPTIMAQLERHVIETKAGNNATATAEKTTPTVPSSPLNESHEQQSIKLDEIPRMNNVASCAVASTDSGNGTDESIMASFPELKAFVNQLETDRTVAIADALQDKMSFVSVEEVMSEEETSRISEEETRVEEGERSVGTEEVPSDEGPESSQDESEASQSSQDEDVESFPPMPSIEPRDFERHVRFRSEAPNRGAIVALACPDLTAIEIFRFDPADGLNQLATFLDEQHATCDRACFVLCCNSDDMHS